MEDVFYSDRNVPTILLTTITAGINITLAHLFPSSRLNATNPMVYWYAAYALSVKRNKVAEKGKERSALCFGSSWILYYFITYFMFGCIIFSNFNLFV